MTLRKRDLIRCDAPLAGGGRCARWTVAGSSCGHHPAPPVPRTPRPARACRCERPMPSIDEFGVWCLKCARWIAIAKERRPVTPPNATNGIGPSDRSRHPVPEATVS